MHFKGPRCHHFSGTPSNLGLWRLQVATLSQVFFSSPSTISCLLLKTLLKTVPILQFPHNKYYFCPTAKPS